MTFEELKQTISQYAQENNETQAIALDDFIEEHQIIERLTYPVYIQLTLDFLKQAFSKLKLSNLDDLLTDIEFSEDFLANKITAKQLENRRIVAWKNYAKLQGHEKYAQRITISNLFEASLLNLDDPTAQGSLFFIIADELNMINDDLALEYYWELYKNLPE